MLPKKLTLRPGLELYLLAYLTLQGERHYETNRLPYSAVAFWAADNLLSEVQTETLFYLVDELDNEYIKRKLEEKKRDAQREFARTRKPNR